MQTADGTVLPLRPLTIGELLDSSIGLLRRCGWPLLLLGLVLAAGRQALVSAIRPTLGPELLPSDVWVLAACWLGAESFALAVLAAPATARAVDTLVGAPVSPGPRALFAAPGARWWGAFVAAGVLGVLALLSVLFCVVPWFGMYALTGLVVPVLVGDRGRPPALLTRPVRLVFRGNLRPAAVRLLGYLGWLALRVGIGLAAYLLLQRLAGTVDSTALTVIEATPWVLIDAIAYPALACLDACTHVENRMRTEGLDLALSRARRSDTDDARRIVEAV